MANRATRRRNRSRKVIAGGLTVAAMLAATSPLILPTAHAAGITYDWVRQNDKLDQNGGWYSGVAMSADGSVLLSSVSYGTDNQEESPLYISRDNGSSWENIAEDIDSNISHNWTNVDVSNDGEILVAASDSYWDYDAEDTGGGGIFISENSGDTWSEVSPMEDIGDGEFASIGNWQHIAVSGDGSRIAAITDGDKDNVYISDDGGDSWNTSAVPDVEDWHSLSISDDGSKILVGGENESDLVAFAAYSDDGGDSWEDISPQAEELVYEVRTAMSSNGDKMAVSLHGWASGSEYDSVYLSENNGDSWADISPENEDNNHWSALAMSDDGTLLAVTDTNSGYVHFSDNDGEVWDSVHPGTEYEDDTINWFSMDLNADGSRFIGSGGEEVYTATAVNDDSEDGTEAVNFSNAEDGKSVVLTLPSGTTVTCHSAVKESGLSVQDAGYQYPVGLVDFCFSTDDESNEISLLFVTDLKPDQVVARKYNPTTQQYATVAGVSITETTHSGQHALLLTYTIVDNGPLDLDPDDGEIADPIGLASTLGAPNTGVGSVRDFLFVKR